MADHVQIIHLRVQPPERSQEWPTSYIQATSQPRATPPHGADTPVFTPNPNPNNIASRQGDQEESNCFFRRVLALGKESADVTTFDQLFFNRHQKTSTAYAA